METELRELRTKQAESAQTVNRIEQERQDAEARANYAENQRKVRECMLKHPQYAISETAASKATEEMFLKQQIRLGRDGALWVVLNDPQTHQPATYSLADGITKYLESPDGQYHRPTIRPGMGSQSSSAGRTPMSVPNGTPPVQQPTHASGVMGALSFQDAIEQAKRNQQNPQQPGPH
jgi:hypothetical protein